MVPRGAVRHPFLEDVVELQGHGGPVVLREILRRCVDLGARLAEPGEVLAAGGKALTLVDLSDMYMTIYLPTDKAGQVALGGEARISIPAETQTGKLFRLRGKGVKSVRNGETGDLLCRVVLETPVKLTARQRELIEELDASFGGENAHTHSPRNRSWLDGVKQFWDRVTS